MDRELRDVFVLESRELLDRASDALSQMGRDPADAAAFEALFRAVHTLKGSAGLVEFAPMGDLYHLAEDRLMSAGGGRLEPGLIEAFVELFDLTAGWLEALAREGEAPKTAAAQAQALKPAFAMQGASKAESPIPSGELPDWALDLRGAADADATLIAIRYQPAINSYFLGEDPLAVMNALPGLANLRLSLREDRAQQEDYDPFRCDLLLTGVSTASRAELQGALRLIGDQVELVELPVQRAALAGGLAAPLRSIRIDAARLDAFGAALDELIVLKNNLSQLTGQMAGRLAPGEARALLEGHAALDRQAAGLHEALVRLRTAPLAPLFRRFPRLVRETALQLGKEVDFTTAGGEVEVDKAIADGLYEPLLHMVRNALDHGIELPGVRERVGKPRRGALRLVAATDHDEVVIEVIDDGRGLDAAALREAAVARGLVGAESAADLSDEEALELPFQPGFSTAKAVTDLSGRGVGLDAVRHAVRALGGSVRLRGRPGTGSTAELRLPMRVRLAKLMMVEAAGETYAVPIEKIVETSRLPASRINAVRAGHAFVWRDRALPLLQLASLVGAKPPMQPAGDLKVMIIQAQGEFAAIVVDQFGEPLETTMRPMGGLLAKLPGMLGTAATADGRVVMVLDPEELVG